MNSHVTSKNFHLAWLLMLALNTAAADSDAKRIHEEALVIDTHSDFLFRSDLDGSALTDEPSGAQTTLRWSVNEGVVGPPWVKWRHFCWRRCRPLQGVRRTNCSECLLLPQQRTSHSALGMSANSQKRTSCSALRLLPCSQQQASQQHLA